MNEMNKLFCRSLSSASASITRIHREKYLLPYLTKVIRPDGSSITVRHHEPKQIIKLPLDLSTLSESEAKARLDRRKPKTKVVLEDEDLGSFDARKYTKLIKNRKRK